MSIRDTLNNVIDKVLDRDPEDTWDEEEDGNYLNRMGIEVESPVKKKPERKLTLPSDWPSIDVMRDDVRRRYTHSDVREHNSFAMQYNMDYSRPEPSLGPTTTYSSTAMQQHDRSWTRPRHSHSVIEEIFTYEIVHETRLVDDDPEPKIDHIGRDGIKYADIRYENVRKYKYNDRIFDTREEALDYIESDLGENERSASRVLHDVIHDVYRMLDLMSKDWPRESKSRMLNHFLSAKEDNGVIDGFSVNIAPEHFEYVLRLKKNGYYVSFRMPGLH